MENSSSIISSSITSGGRRYKSKIKGVELYLSGISFLRMTPCCQGAHCRVSVELLARRAVSILLQNPVHGPWIPYPWGPRDAPRWQVPALWSLRGPWKIMCPVTCSDRLLHRSSLKLEPVSVIFIIAAQLSSRYPGVYCRGENCFAELI